MLTVLHTADWHLRDSDIAECEKVFNLYFGLCRAKPAGPVRGPRGYLRLARGPHAIGCSKTRLRNRLSHVEDRTGAHHIGHAFS